MTAEKKPTYTQIKSRYENVRKTTLDIAHEQLAHVMTNKQGAILKSNISFDSITFNCQKELRKWEKTGLRQVAWNWDIVQRNIDHILNVFNYQYGIKSCIYAVRA